MAKSKRPWHICDDCLEPIAEELSVLLNGRMRRWGADDVSPVELSGVLRDHHFDFGLTWLQICVSVEFAEKVRRAVKRPLRRYEKLHMDCCWRVGVSGGYIQNIAITRAIDWDWDEWRSKHPAVEGREQERPESETEDRFIAILHKLQEAITFLRHSSPVLRALIERRGVKLKEIPTPGSDSQPLIHPDHRTKPLAIQEAGVLLNLMPPATKSRTARKRRDAARQAMRTLLKQGFPHEKVGKKYVFDKRRFPESAQTHL